MLGSLMLYLKGMRIMMFQLSGFYCTQACLNVWMTVLNVQFICLYGRELILQVQSLPSQAFQVEVAGLKDFQPSD